MNGLDAHWWWLIAAGLLALVELFVPGVFFIWLSAAAVITGLAVMATGIGLPFQLALFALLAVAAVLVGRRVYDRNPVDTSDPALNDRTARLIGQHVTVVDAISGGRGRVRVGDSVWTAQGSDAPAGASVRIVGADGNVLLVAPD